MKALLLVSLSLLSLCSCSTEPERPSPVSGSASNLGWSRQGVDAPWEGSGAWGGMMPTSR